MAENKKIPPFECNMYSIGFNKGRKAATDDIIEAIDDFLKYDYPEELNDGFIRGMKKAREIVKDGGAKMAENKMQVGIKYRVTKGNSDGSIFVGDVIMLDNDGDIVCDKGGWLEKDQLTPDVMDFEVEEIDKIKWSKSHKCSARSWAKDLQ